MKDFYVNGNKFNDELSMIKLNSNISNDKSERIININPYYLTSYNILNNKFKYANIIDPKNNEIIPNSDFEINIANFKTSIEEVE